MMTLISEKIKVSNLLSNAEVKEFGMLYIRDIASQYPFSSETTAISYINDHKNKSRPNITTKSRKIWKGYTSKGIVGYTMVTVKDGLSIKFGPTIIKKKYRGKQYGTLLRLEVEKYYQARGIIFTYSTTQEFNKPAQNYVINAGYKKEISLKSHFIPGISEIVFRKKINKTKLEYINFEKKDVLLVTDIYDTTEININNIINSNGENFGFIKSEKRILNKTYNIFNVNNFSIACIAKKGNSFKIIPLYIEYNKTKISNLLDKIFEHYDGQFNLTYVYLPKNSKFEKLFLELGFLFSGFLVKVVDNKFIELSVLSKSI